MKLTSPIKAEAAMKKFGISEKDIGKLDKNQDGKIDFSEARNWGAESKNESLFAHLAGMKDRTELQEIKKADNTTSPQTQMRQPIAKDQSIFDIAKKQKQST